MSSQKPQTEDSGQRQCARGDWCTDPRITTAADGTITRLPALTYRPFCDLDRTRLGSCLAELAPAYGRLARELSEPSRRGPGASARSPFGPRLPLRADVDALQRLIASTLCMWEARVRGIPAAGLRHRDPRKPIHSPQAVGDAAATLDRNLDALLALPPAWTSRAMPLPEGRHGRPPAINAEFAAEYGQHEIVRFAADSVTLMVLADGADAGNEIMRLRYLALKVLGETRARPEVFEGVPCRNCGDYALTRADPPSSPDLPAAHAVCGTCKHTMTRKTYEEWTAWYAKWADTSGLACRHCQRQDHDACTWAKCECRAHQHAA